MKRYNELHKKLQKGIISNVEILELNFLAFGKSYMESNDKGTLKEYNKKLTLK
jgi:hypothetical protein